MGFNERIAIGVQFENDVEAYCARKFISVAKNGTEHTHPEFVSGLRSNNSVTSKLIRFAPDGIVLHKDSNIYHWEAKASDKIEKDAYETYMKYVDIGHNVILFAKQFHNVYLKMINKIVLIDGNTTVNKFSHNRRHPVVDKWIYPRNGHGNAGNGSGTPYREIDIDSMSFIKDFYK